MVQICQVVFSNVRQAEVFNQGIRHGGTVGSQSRSNTGRRHGERFYHATVILKRSGKEPESGKSNFFAMSMLACRTRNMKKQGGIHTQMGGKHLDPGVAY